MRRVLFATVSVVALGLGAMGLGYAQGNSAVGNTAAGNSGNAPPAMHAVPQSAQPAMNAPAPGTAPSTAGQTSRAGEPSMGGQPTQGQAMQHMTGHPSSTSAAGLSQREVREAQQKLRQENFYHGHIDGLIGPKTRQALRHYQSANGLRVTATLDQQTLDSLLGTAAAGVGSSSPPRANHHSRTMTK